MMKKDEKRMFMSDIGPVAPDQSGAVVGVSRLDPAKSYPAIGGLLKEVIASSDQTAWAQIKSRIDYMYLNLDKVLSVLDQSEGFVQKIKARVQLGQKLLFKPNGISVEIINPHNLLPFPGSFANTEWAFVAAVMRWFHDKAGISYYQMMLGEAATQVTTRAAQYTIIKKSGRPVTTEAAYEGRSDDFYGGWGFYFVRRYLSDVLPSASPNASTDASAETSGPCLQEDPMRGLEESMAGIYIAPGDARDKLMVYDLNKISDDPSKGREVAVPNGENFTSIILHKVIVGGDPSDPADCKKYPGCVLINLPKLKIHTQALLTNAIKNLGIGLYPMQAIRSNHSCWEYATPCSDIPAIKSKIPHQVWVPKLDMQTLTPQKNAQGDYIVEKTGGLTATMLDIIQAVVHQDIFMLHIVDAIEAVNRDHQGTGLGIAVAEGLIVAGCDAVAVDLFCARYMFSNVGLKEAHALDLDDGFGGRFPQAVPVPRYENASIVTDTGYDCPLVRDRCLKKAEQQGLGHSEYHVIGWDATADQPLASVNGRLGRLDGEHFKDIHTQSLFWDMYKMPWDLQKTFFAYLETIDQLEGQNHKERFLRAFDETGDKTVTYEEYGKKGMHGPTLYLGALYMSLRGVADESEMYRSFYALIATPLRGAHPQWNNEGHDFSREFFFGSVAVVAWMMSQFAHDFPDKYCPGLSWGNGRWPSFAQAMDQYLHQIIYGWKFPHQIGVFSLYGSAFAFADCRQNNRRFIGKLFGTPNGKAPDAYLKAVANKEVPPLDFTLFVPAGYGANGNLPHIKETSDPAKIFTAEFEQGRVRWPDAKGTQQTQ